MATKKPIAKPAKKVATKTVKKAEPAKKAVKPAVKKAAAKPAPTKVVKAVKPVAKKAVKPAAKPAPAKKAVAKVAQPVAKKKVAPVQKKPVKPVPPAKKPMPKKEIKETKIVKKEKTVAPKVEPKAKAVAKTPAKAEVKSAHKPVAKPAGNKANAKNPKDIKIEPAKPVTIPKLATKTSRKYQPDFTKSVLDEQKHEAPQTLVRYSDTELAEFKELIQRKLEAAKKELSYLQGFITRKDDQGGDDTDNRYMTMEDGSLSMEREQLSQMASRQITYTDNLQKALVRIENKTYGICRETGKLIDKARLRAVPHATLSIEAKNARNNNK